MTNNEITIPDARVDAVEHDVRLAMDDLNLDRDEAIDAVISDSDFIPEDDMEAVADEMRARIEADN